MNDSDAPTREMYERLVASCGMAGKVLRWWKTYPHPAWFGDDYELPLDNIQKLRAACLLLGIPWPDEQPPSTTRLVFRPRSE